MFVRVDNSEGEKRLYGSLADNVEFVQTLPRSLSELDVSWEVCAMLFVVKHNQLYCIVRFQSRRLHSF